MQENDSVSYTQFLEITSEPLGEWVSCYSYQAPFHHTWVYVHEVTFGTPKDGGLLPGEPTINRRDGNFSPAPLISGRREEAGG